MQRTRAVELATELTAAWLANHNTRTSIDDVPTFLISICDAVIRLSKPDEIVDAGDLTGPSTVRPAVSVRKSLASPDHILSMLDGKPYMALRRHLKTNGLTPDEYRRQFGLPIDYPMVAPNYSESRRAFAKSIGLGRKAEESDKPTAISGKTVRRTGKAALDAAKRALGIDL